MSVTEKDFRIAIENPRQRQNFLDRVDLEEYAKYVKAVVYAHPGKIQALMRVKTSLLCRAGFQNSRSTIQVYPSAFDLEEVGDLNGFLSVLLDHEGYHCKEVFERPELGYSFSSEIRSLSRAAHLGVKTEKFLVPFYASRREICAEVNQLLNASKRGLSEEQKSGIFEYIKFWHKALVDFRDAEAQFETTTQE